MWDNYFSLKSSSLLFVMGFGQSQFPDKSYASTVFKSIFGNKNLDSLMNILIDTPIKI